MISTASQRVLILLLGTGACLVCEAPAQDSTRSDASSGPPEEELLEFIDDEETSATVAEMLSWLHENPIDLNRAQRDELLAIPGVNAEDAEAILRFREREGPFGSVEAIRRMPGGEETAVRIRPYVFVQPANPSRPSGGAPRLQFSSRLSGFLSGTASAPSSGALGGPAKSVSRVALRVSRHVQIGLLFEKDSGERIRDGFASGYISYHGNGIVEQLVLGDFCAEAGQGLVLSRGASFGRNGNVADGIRRHAARLVPNRLADESRYLRGGALVMKSYLWALPVRCFLVLSKTSLAANLDDQGAVTSFNSTGLYRTEKELEMRDAVHEFLAGTRIECELGGRGTIGMTYYRSVFDRPVRQSSPNAFSGDRSEVAGGDLALSVGKASFFGELARTAEGGIGWIAGLVIPLDSLFRATIAYRDYADDFDNPHSSGYGVQTNTTNERGISIGWSVRLGPGLSLQGYADQCKIPTSTYGSLLPRTASDFLVQVCAFPIPSLRLSVALRKSKAEAMRSGPGILPGSTKVQDNTDRTSARIAARMEIFPHVDAKIRIEHRESRYSRLSQVETGNMASQTFCFAARGMEWECGVAFFDADSYDARLYDFEGNLRGSIASPPLCGKGSRWHVLVSWDPIPSVSAAAKYAVMLPDKGTVTRELGVQVELRF